jgi:hypothetical protein
MSQGPLTARPATGGRPFPILLAGFLFVIIGSLWIGMGVQNLLWDEYKPGKPMDPDLLPWTIALILFGSAYLASAIGMLGMRSWGRKSAFLLGALGMGMYSYWEKSPLLMMLFAPGLLVLLALIYLGRPSVKAKFR